MKRYFTLFTLLFSMLLSPVQAQEKQEVMSNLYSLITQQQGWLNTSRPIAADDLKGRIILLDFWTYGCINCMHIIPDLHALEEKFGSDLTVIGVHSAKFKNESDTKNIRGAILRFDINHPVVNDFDFSTWNAFGIRAWPTLVLINPKGIIESTYAGEGHRAELAQDIENLQKKYAGKINNTPLPIALERDKQQQSILSFPGKLAYTDGSVLGKGAPLLFVADNGHKRIAVMTLDGTVVDSIGSGKEGRDDGDFAKASFSTIQGIVYKNNLLYIADTNNHLLRVADLTSRKITTIAGTGAQGSDRSVVNKPALETALSSPWDITFYPDESHLAIAMAGLHQIWSYDVNAKTVSVIAGNGNESIEDGRFPDNALAQTSGLSAYDGKLYFVDAESSSLRVYDNGLVKTLIGTGLFDFGYREGVKGTALLQHPLALAAGGDGVYVADSYNHSLRKYDPKTAMLTNFSGHGERGNTDGALADAMFNEPSGVMRVLNNLYISDTNNNQIRVVDLKSGKVSTLKLSEKH